MTLTAGIDVGSTYTKVVIADQSGRIAGQTIFRSGFNFAVAAEKGLTLALENAGLAQSDVDYIAATGFGRYMVPIRDLAITELTCHARAAKFFLPTVRTVLDVGGQGVKAIKLDEKGRVKAFRLNDKCAAGSGAFLEKTVRYMGFDVDQIVELVEGSTDPVTVSSVCAVFAESEVINHLSAGKSGQDVCAGALISLGQRAAMLVKRVKPEADYLLTGGLSRVPSMKAVLEKELKCKFQVMDGEAGVMAGALGAALLAHARLRRLQTKVGA